jgi:hypothetical protein
VNIPFFALNRTKMKNKNTKIRKKRVLKDRMAILVLLVGLMGCSVIYQYYHYSAIAKERSAIKHVSVGAAELPKIAPKKEMMENDALRCESGYAKTNLLAGKYSLDQFVIKKNIEKLVGNKPMKNMVSEISSRNPKTASYLVAIAKHESNLGKFSPKKDGKDCFNYWGFRGTYNRTDSGYSCFDSPEQAVLVVGDRIQGLTEIENITTPEEMLVWKCGVSCASHDPGDVMRWKRDVDFYYKKISS